MYNLAHPHKLLQNMSRNVSHNSSIQYAAEHGWLPALDVLLPRTWYWRFAPPPIVYDVCRSAIKYEQINVLAWLQKQGFPLNSINIEDQAVRQGSLNILTWLWSQQAICWDRVLDLAIMICKTEIINFIVMHGLATNIREAAHLAKLLRCNTCISTFAHYGY